MHVHTFTACHPVAIFPSPAYRVSKHALVLPPAPINTLIHRASTRHATFVLQRAPLTMSSSESPRGTPRNGSPRGASRGSVRGARGSRTYLRGSRGRGRARGTFNPNFSPTYQGSMSPRAGPSSPSTVSKTGSPSGVGTAAANAVSNQMSNFLPDGVVAFVGAGNMARALIDGLLSNGMNPDRLRASARTATTLDKLRGRLPEAALYTSNARAAGGADVVILCVKPAQTADVVREISDGLSSGATLISVAAGVSLAELESALGEACGSVTVVRAMPNVGAQAGRGVTGLCGRFDVATAPKNALATFAASGSVHVVDEKLLGALTAVSGCGIAYCMMLAEAMADAGVRHGLPRDVARKLAAGTLEGAGALARMREDTHFAELRNQIESPGGVTVAATAALERGGLRAATLDAVDSAMERLKEVEK